MGDFVEYDLNKGQRVVETVDLHHHSKIDSGESLVLMDVTDFDEIETVHIAANLPCKSSKGPNEGPENDTPDVKIIAGNSATGIFGDVIESAADDTGLEGPKKSCIFHDTFRVNPEVPEITDIVLVYDGPKKSVKLEDVVVTITINGDTDRSQITEVLRDLEEIKKDVKAILGTVLEPYEFMLDA